LLCKVGAIRNEYPNVAYPLVFFLLQHPATKNYDLSHIRYLFCGAAPLSKEISKQLVNVIPNAAVGQGYGK